MGEGIAFMTDSANQNDPLPLHRKLVTEPEYAKAIPYPADKTVRVYAYKRMTPAEARSFAVQLLYIADFAEGLDDGIGSFGYAAEDSRALGELRSVIEEHLGWQDDEQEVDADHVERVIQVGKLLKQRLKLRVVKP
jgi:hypothetical protein